MSKRVDFDEVTRRGYRGRLINWERWCDGDAHLLEQGVDFQGRVDSTRSAGIQWAARHDLKSRTSIVDGGFVFQIIDGLSDEMVAVAKRLQSEQGELSDEARRELRKLRQGPQPEPPDPVAERRERLSDQLADGEGREVLQAHRHNRGRLGRTGGRRRVDNGAETS